MSAAWFVPDGDVDARATDQQVIAGTANQQVVAGASNQAVVPLVAENPVVAVASVSDVIANAAVEDITAVVAVQQKIDRRRAAVGAAVQRHESRAADRGQNIQLGLDRSVPIRIQNSSCVT